MRPYYEQDGITIIHGDCRDVLPTLDSNSIDAVVTDPPYGLEFMGKDWDRGVPGVLFWEAALRVAKPGAHLLAFGGTRTFHRLAVAIEDAGWEIRDCIMWVYGSGFPKSLNIGKNPLFCQCSSKTERPSCNGDHTSRELRPSRRTSSNPDDVAEDGCYAVAGHDPSGSLTGSNSQTDCPGSRRFDDEQPLFSEGSALDVEPSLTDAQTHIRCCEPSPQTQEDTTRSLDRPEYSAHPSSLDLQTQNGDYSCSSGTSYRHHTIDLPLCQVCGKPIADGYGTALKPAWEPIIVARKPLVGTAARNVLEWGTGAVNIAGCRVGWASEADESEAKGKNQHTQYANPGSNRDSYSGSMPPRQDYNAPGRWPANLVHDGSEEVLTLFPVSKDGIAIGGKGRSASIYGTVTGGMKSENQGYGGVGSAARFFACFPIDATCTLCNLPIQPRHSIMSAGDEACNPIPALTVAECLMAIRVITRSTALENAHRQHVEQIARNAKSAASLCDSCATSIAAVLVGIKTSAFSLAESQAILDSTCGFNSSILIQSLVPFVEMWASIDIIPTTAALSMLFGSVSHAIASSTKQASAVRAEGGNGRATATRFMYSPKASRSERGKGNTHPTVKPLALMRWLCRLVTPPGGLLLDPFMGSGTTLLAATKEGFRGIGIDCKEEHCGIAARRLQQAVLPLGV